MHCLFARILYDNAYQTTFAVVYDFLHGVLKLYLTFSLIMASLLLIPS